MTEKLIFILMLILLAPVLANEKKIDAEKSKADACMKQVDSIGEKARNIDSIRSSFRQVKKLSFLNSEVVSGGVFLFRKDEEKSQVRWEYTSPFSYIIVINGDDIVMKDNEKVSRFDMSTSKMFEEINEILIKSLNGTILTDRKNFTFKYTDKDDELHVLMVPEKENLKKYFKSIKMVISKKDYAVSFLKMTESSGDSTSLFFTNKKINGDMSGKEFEVK